MLTTELETVDVDPDPGPDLARITAANAAPAPTAAMAASMIHFLWIPKPVLVVVGVISPDFAGLVIVGVISPDFAEGCSGAGAGLALAEAAGTALPFSAVYWPIY
jgi:hypothetical protein